MCIFITHLNNAYVHPLISPSSLASEGRHFLNAMIGSNGPKSVSW